MARRNCKSGTLFTSPFLDVNIAEQQKQTGVPKSDHGLNTVIIKSNEKTVKNSAKNFSPCFDWTARVTDEKESTITNKRRIEFD